MADQFGTVLQLERHLRREVDPEQALQALELVTGEIQSVIGQRLVRVADDPVMLYGGGPDLWLPQRPVVTVDAVTTTERGVTTARAVNVHYSVIGPRLHWLYGWLGWPELVTVTYTHGFTADELYQGVQPELVLVRKTCLEAAGRMIANPEALRSETIGPISWTAAGASDEVGPGLTETEQTKLRLAFAIPLAA